MKTTLHYIIAILLFSLNATHAFAEEMVGPFNITDKGQDIKCSYDEDSKLLIIDGTGSITITRNENPIEAGIVMQNNHRVSLTMENLHIQAKVPLTVNVNQYADASAFTNIILKGINILESNAEDPRPGMFLNWSTKISGSGSLTVKGSSSGGAGIGFGDYIDDFSPMTIQDNIVVVAIGGKNASGIDQTKTINHEGGLLIQGQEAEDGINYISSVLAGDLTLGSNFEIPSWATVTIADGQTFTISTGQTLTNKGTLSFGRYAKLNGSLEQIKNEGGGKMVCDVSITLFEGGAELKGIENLNLYNPQKGEYLLTANNTYDISSLPVISDGYELRVGNYPVGQKITTPSGDWMGHVNVISLSFYIETDKVDVIRVKDQPVPPYEPETTKPDHTLKWYKDDAYTTPMTDGDWENTGNALSGKSIYGRWEANPDPVDPDPVEPDPTPIYYSVYLPQVEGASTDPGPGEYEVEAWDNFRFYLTIDSAYSESQPVVTTDRGETLVPRTSDGAYLVKYVRTDVEVFIDGLIQNPPPVANEAIGVDALAPQIWTEGSMLCIRMAEALPSAPVRIFTVDGRLHAGFDSTPGLNRRQLPTGIYIVRVGDTACKVIIK